MRSGAPICSGASGAFRLGLRLLSPSGAQQPEEQTEEGLIPAARRRSPTDALWRAELDRRGLHCRDGPNVTFVRRLVRWASAHVQALGLSFLLVVFAAAVFWFFASFVPDRREAAVEGWRREPSLRADHRSEERRVG